MTKTSANKKQLKQLLQSKPYQTCLKKVNYIYLKPKEKVYISVLKMKNYTVLSILHRLEAFWIKITGKTVYKNH